LATVLTLSANAGTIFDNTTTAITGQDGIANSGTDGNGNGAHGPIFESFVTGTNVNATGFNLDSVLLSLYAGTPGDGGSFNVGLYSTYATDGSLPAALVATLGTVLDSSLTGCASVGGV